MISDLISGIGYFFRGLKLITMPGLRRFLIGPFIVNVIVFAAAIWFGIYQFDNLLEWMLPTGDSWWIELTRNVLWVLFSIIIFILLFFTFSVAANIIGSPFNSLLAEKTEQYLAGQLPASSGGISDFMQTILPSLKSEIKKVTYFILIAVSLFIILLLPGLNLLSPVLWTIFTSWMLSTEYVAYPMENHKMYFSQVRKTLKTKKLVVFGFGMTVMIITTIPVLNFLVMPAAVAGATALWVERFTQSHVND